MYVIREIRVENDKKCYGMGFDMASYWLDLFTGKTWAEFLEYGEKTGKYISGFRESMRNKANDIRPGDVLICYLTGVSRWVGTLEVIERYKDEATEIWSLDQFPVRFQVRPLVVLLPEYGVPLGSLEGKVGFYETAKDRGKYRGFLRSSPRLFRSSDAEQVINALGEAQRTPVDRPVVKRQLDRVPMYRTRDRRSQNPSMTTVTVPDSQGSDRTWDEPLPDAAATIHTQMQHLLASLGNAVGMRVWVAANDRKRIWQGEQLGELPGVLTELPIQFPAATQRTVELIDVLWIRGRSIVAAFEVESTTAVSSGILRMSDLVTLQPNLQIDLFIVAPEERRPKVQSELLRPTFRLSEPSLTAICGFLGFHKIQKLYAAIETLGLESGLKPEFLRNQAEYFGAPQR